MGPKFCQEARIPDGIGFEWRGGCTRSAPLSCSAMRFATVTLLALTLISSASAQWTTQSPVPTSLDVRGIAAPTADRVFITTANGSFDEVGSLFESLDGGASWIAPPEAPTMRTIFADGITSIPATFGHQFSLAAVPVDASTLIDINSVSDLR